MELIPAVVRLPADLDATSVAALTRALEDACASPAPVVVLIGASEETYCLGLALGRHDAAAPAQAFADVLAAMHAAPKPLLAVVDGRAIGGGMGLACACDWLIATDRASFGLPELLWGLVPAIIWPVIADRVGGPVARRWAVSAHSRSAAEALAAGLVDDLVPPDRLDAAVRRATRALRRLDADALRHLRAWARASQQPDLPAALRLGADLTTSLGRQPTVRQRWQAFADGEAPWSA
jgi:enoyl-CoA hydratase/carnithine racemase